MTANNQKPREINVSMISKRWAFHPEYPCEGGQIIPDTVRFREVLPNADREAERRGAEMVIAWLRQINNTVDKDFFDEFYHAVAGMIDQNLDAILVGNSHSGENLP